MSLSKYLRISALRRLGRANEARTYLMKYPASPQATAVRTFLMETP